MSTTNTPVAVKNDISAQVAKIDAFQNSESLVSKRLQRRKRFKIGLHYFYPIQRITFLQNVINHPLQKRY
jgi:hypothetical protein